MAETTKIGWTDATWNPVTGCSIVSPGCTNCYAMGLAGTRLKHHPSRAGLTTDSKAGPVWSSKVRLNEAWLTQPLQWKRPRRIFVCAHGDLFAEGVPDEWIDRVFAVMARAPQHTFQVLTKRAARMREWFEERWQPAPAQRIVFPGLPAYDMPAQAEGDDRHERVYQATGEFLDLDTVSDRFWNPDGSRKWQGWPLPNVWLGVSAEDQRRANERVPDLLATPAAVRFVSAEPLLGPIDFRDIKPLDRAELNALRGMNFDQGMPCERLDWVIVGGESGAQARPTHPAWVRAIRDQCATAGTAFFFKQWGSWQPRAWCRDGGTHAMREGSGQISFQAIQSHPNSIERVGAGPEWSAFALVGKKAAGRALDGEEHNGMPPLGQDTECGR
ncbi:phage Gp37/Gp68 family protein [Methylobacterium gossipiicola]|uniref:Protein gp37 n=1 Tax=Methylobacterium gossipiicola TaxID=582675 RepID=A0A1I2TLQ0_9HYPH|nr:phage Gp37/Gp68 family protein [Methylobacterium gossipiicola]SFG65743.1 protein gp37 [Methylobacterium gossipiicola]